MANKTMDEPKFYAIDPLDAYPEAVGTLDKLEHHDGALWVHLNGKRSKLVGLQSLTFLIGQLEQIRAQVFGRGVAVKRYIQNWNMQESYERPDGEWVKAADHFADVAELRAWGKANQDLAQCRADEVESLRAKLAGLHADMERIASRTVPVSLPIHEFAAAAIADALSASAQPCRTDSGAKCPGDGVGRCKACQDCAKVQGHE